MRYQSCLPLILFPAALFLGLMPQKPSRSNGSEAGEQSPPEQNLAIVVNRSNPVENLSMAELRKIFLGERGHWPNGRRITLVMMEPGQPERKLVLHDICQMDEKAFNNHFMRGLFTGEVFVSPKTLATPEGVRKFIFNVPGAIGYLRATDIDASVKIIRIDERLPNDKGYKLHLPMRQDK
jgi:hypothetical protein